MRSLALGLFLVTPLFGGCGSDSLSGGVTVTAAEPAFGSLVGGTRIILTGTGFSVGGAAPDRVLVGGHEAPLAAAINDSHLEVEVPPGETAGDAEIVVYNHRGQGSATGIFHYSTAPVITSITPSDILYSTPTTAMTVTGSGFKDENAGFVHVRVDGMDAVDVQILSDTQVKFTALAAQPLVRPSVSIVDDRGVGSLANAFRYVPSTHHGLIVFPRSGATFFDFFDPTDQSVTSVARINSGAEFSTGVVIKGNDLYTTTRNQNSGQAQLGKIDFRTQALTSPIQLQTQIISLTAVGDTVYAMENSQFGTLDVTTGLFSRIADVARGTEIAADDTGQLYTLSGTGSVTIATIDATGALGAGIGVAGAFHISDARFLDGVLYAIDWNNNTGNTALITISPTTGATTVIKAFDDQRSAMEVFK